MKIITIGTVISTLDMFDGNVDTQTEATDQISQSFDVSGYNSVVCLNNYGVSATLTVNETYPPTQVYSETVSLNNFGVKDWWDFYFAPVRVGRDLIWYFPEIVSGTATVTIDYVGGTAKCGLCLPGKAEDMGHALWGAKIGISDYSIIDTNNFGLTYLSVGDWARRADINVSIALSNADNAFNLVSKNRALATIYDFNQYTFDDSGTSLSGYDPYIIYGFLEGFTSKLKNHSHNVVNFEAQGIR